MRSHLRFEKRLLTEILKRTKNTRKIPKGNLNFPVSRIVLKKPKMLDAGTSFFNAKIQTEALLLKTNKNFRFFKLNYIYLDVACNVEDPR